MQIALNGKPSDLLGIGDIVFPSLLAGYSLHSDLKKEANLTNPIIDDSVAIDPVKVIDMLYIYNPKNVCTIHKFELFCYIYVKLNLSMFQASLAGYALGCLLCELFQTGSGQPALIYIVPSMFLVLSMQYLIISAKRTLNKNLKDFS